MTVSRALLFATFMVAAPFAAYGQFGGMPGMPGSVPGGGGFGVPPAGPPSACRELLAMRDEVQKHGTAIQKANERRATVQEACKLFKNFLAAESKFIKSLEENTRTCGVPPDAITRANEGHAKASATGKQVCDAAAQGPRPGGLTGYFWWPRELEQTGDFGGMPDVPGGLPAPDAAGSSEPPAALPTVCRELIALREETHRHEQAVQRATERRAPVYEACRLLKERLVVETKFLKGLEEHGGTCGTPADELKLVKERHASASWIGTFCGRSGDIWTPGENFWKR